MNEEEQPSTQMLAPDLQVIVARALAEDVGDGDITTLCTVRPTAIYEGALIAKAAGILAGLDVVQATFAQVNAGSDLPLDFRRVKADGAAVQPRDVIATVRGAGRTLLSAERTALNFLQRMSGIATLTRRYVDAVAGTQTVILDTRKTAPGLRMLDKLAVKLGGGQNHRIGLFDMVLIKENHVAAAGGITAAVTQVRAQNQHRRKIEVEVRNLDELREALSLQVDQIMLDNMNLDEMRAAVQLTGGAVPLEASGNVSLQTVRAIAATGVDFISVGKLTHSVEALDISFLLSAVNG
ncbi:MAG: carboxylating nicotinate-nucleotide diphosphorylase [Caldilineaceae bacterium]